MPRQLKIDFVRCSVDKEELIRLIEPNFPKSLFQYMEEFWRKMSDFQLLRSIFSCCSMFKPKDDEMVEELSKVLNTAKDYVNRCSVNVFSHTLEVIGTSEEHDHQLEWIVKHLNLSQDDLFIFHHHSDKDTEYLTVFTCDHFLNEEPIEIIRKLRHVSL